LAKILALYNQSGKRSSWGKRGGKGAAKCNVKWDGISRRSYEVEGTKVPNQKFEKKKREKRGLKTTRNEKEKNNQIVGVGSYKSQT